MRNKRDFGHLWCFPSFVAFFLNDMFGLVKFGKSDARKKRAANERRLKFLTSTSAARWKKAARISPRSLKSHMIRENFRGMLCPRRTKFSHELSLSLSLSLSFICNFLLEKFSNAHRSTFLTLDVNCLQQLVVAGEMYHVN